MTSRASPNWLMRSSACWALGLFTDETAIPALRSAAKREGFFLQGSTGRRSGGSVGGPIRDSRNACGRAAAGYGEAAGWSSAIGGRDRAVVEVTKDWPEPSVRQDLATALAAASQKIRTRGTRSPRWRVGNGCAGSPELPRGSFWRASAVRPGSPRRFDAALLVKVTDANLLT
jgi:hypothetical protein